MELWMTIRHRPLQYTPKGQTKNKLLVDIKVNICSQDMKEKYHHLQRKNINKPNITKEPSSTNQPIPQTTFPFIPGKRNQGIIPAFLILSKAT